jgi:AraC-like DNA-binding protein
MAFDEPSVWAVIPIDRFAEVWRSVTGSPERPSLPATLADEQLATGHPALLLGTDGASLDDATATWLEAVVRAARAAVPERRPPIPRPVRLARELLHERARDKVSLDELATVAGVTRWHLARMFRDAVGLPPHRYHMALRLWHAREQIRGGATLSEAAHACGFADQSHLSLRFQRQYGTSPSAFVAMLGRSSIPAPDS